MAFTFNLELADGTPRRCRQAPGRHAHLAGTPITLSTRMSVPAARLCVGSAHRHCVTT
jgi:hypothetical protein